MLINILLGFILPWISGVFLFKRARVLLYTVVPFTALFSMAGNQLGVQLGFWLLIPEGKIHLMNTIFIDFGYNPIVAAWFIYFLYYKQIRRWIMYPLFMVILNGFEFYALSVGKIIYDQGWHILYSVIIYGIGLIVIDWYFSQVIKAAKPLARLS
ncbi:hypothetical protein [Halobacillus sp. B29]|uniref:hypothetical protein n=1 Tax=Halobacillus sp. B29 TaxID=3457432 RepID=UPI003FCDB81F